jgi:hypothetical protein
MEMYFVREYTPLRVSLIISLESTVGVYSPLLITDTLIIGNEY